MAYLLDTHAFLWFASGDKQLPDPLRKTIKDVNVECFLSSASLWEITIKSHLGKIKLGISLSELFDYTERNQIGVIPVKFDHLLTLSKLPDHHRDPFDRLIVAQAITEGLILISRDKSLRRYKIKQQWA